jgi:hypothetical protein
MTMKWRCRECDWRGGDSDLLRAPNPFDREDILIGCSKCKQAETMVLVCDEDGCLQDATCGTPTPMAYRHTCHRHVPDDSIRVLQ